MCSVCIKEEKGMNLKKWFSADENDILTDTTNDQYYSVKSSEAVAEDGSTKLVLLEPRAFSEAQQIADQLKSRNTVVVNLKRVTSDQAKRIVDFLSGTIYAIGGSLQKIGGGIFLCTPNNVKVNGKISDDSEGKEVHDNGDINIEW
ncbi:MAG TPA: cell division protein SepF [Candidatus Faecisoma merdavium]|nr:cell division protein SepF [Candidatus Faecisoma merdavium]